MEEWLEVGNGCLCCTVKDSGVSAIEALMEKRGAYFDYILLETTGLADPGNLAPLFWMDEGLGSSIYLDGIVTLVDAMNVLRSLDEPTAAEVSGGGTEQDAATTPDRDGDGDGDGDHHHSGPHLSTAHLQISHADVIVINKSDLVTAPQLSAIEARIRSINALAKIHITDHSRVPQLEGLVLDLHAYDAVDAAALDFAAKGHSHLDPAISTVTLTLPPLREAQMAKLDKWLQALLWGELFVAHPDAEGVEGKGVRQTDVHRIKGRLAMVGGGVKLLQGVREVFELLDGADAAVGGAVAGEERGKIVVIGRHIGGEEGTARLQKSLEEAIS